MTTYISILRGINVGGQRIIKMNALQQMFTDLNFQNTQTYIQSGNVIFQSETMKCQDLEKEISKKILERFGFEVPVIVKTLEELQTIVANNPFSKDSSKDQSCLHVTFLSESPKESDFEKIKQGDYQSDEFKLEAKTVFLCCRNGYGKTKLTNGFFESKLKVVATTRNWKTTQELLNIAMKLR